MCGIAGIKSFKRPIDLERIKSMTNVISHRGPDGEGLWVNQEGTTAFGHRRLSIIDLSTNANQPMHYHDKRYTITFNGEIYNYIELKRKLAEKGYSFKTDSDTEVLLALYDHKKELCLADLDGMFSFAIWDDTDKVLFCARDRFGEKPFYYVSSENEFVFASEIKQFFAAGLEKRINPQLMFYYLNFGIEGNPHKPEQTFYNKIYQLLPGHYLVLREQKHIEISRYWSIESNKLNKISFNDAVEKFKFLFDESLKRRLRSDVPVGSCLSGGLDSSSIVLSIDRQKKEGQVQKTFSARFKDFEKDEGKYIDFAVNSAKSIENFNVWLTGNEFVENFDRILKVHDEPFGSASIMAQYFVMELAKKNGITVLIDGQGADEYLLGYLPYYTTYLNQLFKQSNKNYKIEAEKAFEFHGIKHELSMAGRAQLRFPNSFKILSSLKNNLYKKNPSQPLNFLTAEYCKNLEYVDDPNYGKNNDSVREMVANTINGIPFNALLRYADRNAMAHSIEVRLPFLNHELVEFSNSLPDEFKIFQGWSKYILRKSMEKILPKEIVWRKDKIGFAAPQESWMQGSDMRQYVEDSKSFLIHEGIMRKECKEQSSNWRSLMVYKICR